MAEIVGAAFVPGLPHLLAGRPANGWMDLRHATEQLGRDLRAAGAETLMLVSTQWYSVLGLQVQMRPHLHGTRVDENWYTHDFGTLDFRLNTDTELASAWLTTLQGAGFQARPTDYPDFPIDTGCITAMRLLDPANQMRVAQVSLNLYGTPESVELVGRAAAEAARTTGRKVAVVAISALSSQPLNVFIGPGQDRIANPGHERWNRRILDLLAKGDVAEVFRLRADFARQAAADSQLRALSYLHGAVDIAVPADIRAYAPVWGMGATTICWPINKEKT